MGWAVRTGSRPPEAADVFVRRSGDEVSGRLSAVALAAVALAAVAHCGDEEDLFTSLSQKSLMSFWETFGLDV